MIINFDYVLEENVREWYVCESDIINQVPSPFLASG